MQPIQQLLEIMRRLRDPQGGCPWDRAQTFETIVPHTLEEAYEVADAIERGDLDELCDELGDLLFQVVFYAQLAAEQGAFDFEDVAARISDKLVRRHPHVFRDERIDSAEAQTQAWEQYKERERQAKAEREQRAPGALDGVSLALPALVRAAKLQRRAARVGFDWTAVGGVVDKLDEELAELRAVIAAPSSLPQRRGEELGDLLFTCVNVARHLDIDAEAALRGANAKFERRFRIMEDNLRPRGGVAGVNADEREAAWELAKHVTNQENEG
jgi:ATP diphosphatase